MAATVTIRSRHGAAGATETTVSGTTFRFKRADDDASNTTAPIPKPAAGTVYSWRKFLHAKIDATPDGDITNLRFFTDAGSWGTGVTLKVQLMPFAKYVQGATADETAAIGTRAGTGTITSTGAAIAGSGTAFTTELTIGSVITSDGQTRIISAIASNTAATASAAFSPDVSAQAFTIGGKNVGGTGTSGTTDAAGLTSGAPMIINSDTVISNPDTGYKPASGNDTQAGVEGQLEAASTASRGTAGPRTVTFRYDET